MKNHAWVQLVYVMDVIGRLNFSPSVMPQVLLSALFDGKSLLEEKN